MPSKSESGHANNVAQFTDLVNICKSLGSRYNPALEELELATVQPLVKQAELLQANLNKAIPPRTTAVARKDKAFAMLDSRVTRALGMFAIGKALPAQKRSAQTIANSIKGQGGKKGKTKEAVAEGAETGDHTRSTSRRSMDSRVESLYRLIEVLAESGTYATNEPDLTLPQLTAYADELKALSEAVVVAERPEADARHLRNTALYTPETGLVDRGLAIKRYLRSAFGHNSPEYLAVKAIKFKKIKKKQ